MKIILSNAWSKLCVHKVFINLCSHDVGEEYLGQPQILLKNVCYAKLTCLPHTALDKSKKRQIYLWNFFMH